MNTIRSESVLISFPKYNYNQGSGRETKKKPKGQQLHSLVVARVHDVMKSLLHGLVVMLFTLGVLGVLLIAGAYALCVIVSI
jgi:hypothetical protein